LSLVLINGDQGGEYWIDLYLDLVKWIKSTPSTPWSGVPPISGKWTPTTQCYIRPVFDRRTKDHRRQPPLRRTRSPQRWSGWMPMTTTLPSTSRRYYHMDVAGATNRRPRRRRQSSSFITEAWWTRSRYISIP
jgi:hypothetical protein